MSSTSRFTLSVTVATALGLAVVGAAILLSSRAEQAAPSPSPTPRPGIFASAKEVRTVPGVPDARRRAAVDGIAHDLRAFYARAFVVPPSDPGVSPTPRAHLPSSKLGSLMTTAARAAVANKPEVFDEIADLTVYSGTVTFGGLITFEGAKAVEALIEVDFSGQATPIARNAPQIKVRQVGTMVLKRGDNVWLVDGFDLKLGTRPLNTPTPSPT